ncbi:hypothetical protein FHP25_33945 [Vineibacter terrae]|uniref:EF-hand domain-containing protein n=1 Tax=Vineibacter terrae TaxID=2586908 RepID=A0A5C8P9W1_9HYPH|nr:hypothetical protein [Vineibacter terrae]TXL70540.1 hypothetical protein FHP25_33945 [Vineibacter terrae]
MSRKLLAALIIGTLGAGLSTQAMAGDWNNKAAWSAKGGGDRDGRSDWRHRGWEQGNHNGWRDRNHDGRVDWRDRPGVRDFNHDGRVDWRDRRILSRNDRNHDGRLDWRDRRSWWW